MAFCTECRAAVLEEGTLCGSCAVEKLGLREASAASAAAAAPAKAPIAKPATPPRTFEVQLPWGEKREFAKAGDVREAILAGAVPRESTIGGSALPANQAARTVEAWAKSAGDLRQLYEPVWSMTMKGALFGALTVAGLKAVDTFVGLAKVNGGAAMLFLVWAAFLASPKWKPQIAFAGFLVWSQSHLKFAAINIIFGAWFGVAAFGAVFGISAGMAVGTVVGYARRRRMKTAPDALPEGSKPTIWGLAVPASFFAAAAFVYFEFAMPAMVKLFS